MGSASDYLSVVLVVFYRFATQTIGKFPKDGQALHFDDKSILIQSGSDTEKANSDEAVLSSGR